MGEEFWIKVKEYNIASIRAKGYEAIDWLPIRDDSTLRSLDEIKGRISVLNPIINIAFGAPIFIIKSWIEKNNLANYLTSLEKKLLDRKDEDLTEEEINLLMWSLESLWALMWVTKQIDSLNEDENVGDNLASLLPNLQLHEDNSKVDKIATIRSQEDVCQMMDYYYRLHWYCVHKRLRGGGAKLNEGVIYERRKALEWVVDNKSDWDRIEMGT